MRILGITSAIGIVGAGVVDDQGILAECSISSSITQSEKLITLVEDVLKKIRIKINDIDAVAVTTGPGSYSGLRGGLATAKGLVAALDVPIIPVSTLHAIAFNFVNMEGTVAVAVNACRDDYNLSLWGVSRGVLSRLTEDLTVKLENIVDVLSSVKGSLTVASDQKVKDMINSDNILFAEQKNVVPWAVNVAKIGIDKLKKGEIADPVGLVPSYSHKPNIREFKK